MKTQKFPRSLNEAFPNTAEYGNSVEHYKSSGSTIADYLLAIVIGLLGATFLFFWLSY